MGPKGLLYQNGHFGAFLAIKVPRGRKPDSNKPSIRGHPLQPRLQGGTPPKYYFHAQNLHLFVNLLFQGQLPVQEIKLPVQEVWFRKCRLLKCWISCFFVFRQVAFLSITNICTLKSPGGYKAEFCQGRQYKFYNHNNFLHILGKF